MLFLVAAVSAFATIDPGATCGVDGIDETVENDEYHHSFHAGYRTCASGLHATAFGESSVASGADATAAGKDTVASGNQSTATGHGTVASGTTSTAMGYETKASGKHRPHRGHTQTLARLRSPPPPPPPPPCPYRLVLPGDGRPHQGDGRILHRDGVRNQSKR